MGLIKATTGSIGSVLEDQWREYFYCDALDSNVIIRAGVKKNNTKNNNANKDVITDGSIIAVNEGQAMMIVDNGKIVEFSAEAGEFVYDAKTESSCVSGSFGSGLSQSFKNFKKRFTFGSEIPKTQKIYYFNTKEIRDKKFGTPTPVVYDDPVYQSISIRYFGVAALKIVDPIKFYVNVSGNVPVAFDIDKYWKEQLVFEFNNTLTQTLSRLALDGKKYTQIPQCQAEISKYMNDILDEEWIDQRGLEIFSASIAQVTLSPEDRDKVNEIDNLRLYTNTDYAAGRLARAQAQAMENAASNDGGAMLGFMGLNMANKAGGMDANTLYGMNNQGAIQQPTPQPDQSQSVNADTWKCSCGNENTGKFCNNCGNKKPENNTWTCSCGTSNTGKFCSNCGSKKPENNIWTCSCGATNTGKFCSECGSSKV